EDFLFPAHGEDWQAHFPAAADVVRNAPQAAAALDAFREAMERWIEATVLPVDQLILIVGQELFQHPYDMAVTYALAVTVRHDTDQNPALHLTDVMGRIEEVIQNRRPIYGVGGEDADFDPD